MKKTIKTSFVPGCSKRTDHSSVKWIGIVIIIVVLAFAAGWAWSRFGVSMPEPVVESVAETTEEVITEEETPEPVVVTEPNTLVIDWLEINDQKSRSTDYSWNSIVFGDEPLMPEDGVGPKAFALGTVKGGVYDGYELQSYIAGVSGLGVHYKNFYLLVAPNAAKTIILNNYASFISKNFSVPVTLTTASALLGEDGLARLAVHDLDQGGMDYRQTILDSGSTIPELAPSLIVKDTAERYYNLAGVWQRIDYPDEVVFNEPITTTILENGQVLNLYNGSESGVAFADNLFYYLQPDGRMVWYDLDLGISMGESEMAGSSVWRALSINIPEVTWSDGTQNTVTFSRGIEGGCGTIAGINVVDISEMGELKEVGTSAAGKIYAPVSYDTERFLSSFESWKMTAPEGETRETLEQFAAAHPFFYFQDSLGRWIEFTNTEILPMGECGKPVIYLYPETTTDLDVSLYPQGGFTYTEPVYDNGWRVTASPDGTLVNRDDGQTYPYLFWEGRGSMYVPPNRYWVVKQADVHSFLVSTLARLGLNKKETADFLEFWEPRMRDALYYKVGFYGTEVMNQLAPLSISEKPDTLIRVLMDYEPLEAPIKANPPVLPAAPGRAGFTVVEWGGVLR